MKKTITALFAAAALAIGFGAQAAQASPAQDLVGKQVPIEMVEKNTLTQVVVGDETGVYVMATQEKVVDTVLVTPEMANNAVAVSMKNLEVPKVFSIDQASNSGNSEGTLTPFTKLGRMEPVSSMETSVSKVYFLVGSDVYAFETTGEVGNTVTLSPQLMAMATKQN